MTPAAGDFEVTTWADSVFLVCPECDTELWPDLWTLRELIGLASDHARTAHPMSAPTATKVG